MKLFSQGARAGGREQGFLSLTLCPYGLALYLPVTTPSDVNPTLLMRKQRPVASVMDRAGFPAQDTGLFGFNPPIPNFFFKGNIAFSGKNKYVCVGGGVPISLFIEHVNVF